MPTISKTHPKSRFLRDRFFDDFRPPKQQKNNNKSIDKSSQQHNNKKSKKCISYWQGQWIRALGHVMLCTKFNKNGAKIPSKTIVKSTSQLGSILEPTWLHFGRVLGAKLEPSWHQIAPKVDPKSDQKMITFWMALETDFDQFWLQLGGPLEARFLTFLALKLVLAPPRTPPRGLLDPPRAPPRGLLGPILASISKDSACISGLGIYVDR